MTGACDSEVQKTAKIPHFQYIDRIIVVPCVIQRKAPTSQAVQKTVEVADSQSLDRVVDEPVVMLRQSSVTLRQERPRSPSAVL